MATSTDKLAGLIEDRTILDLSAQNNEISGLPRTLAHCDPPPVFTVQDIYFSGLHLTSKVIAQLLGEPTQSPRLTVDPKNRSVTLDGTTYQPDEEFVALLEILANSKGLPVSSNTMKEKCPLLKHEMRFDRLIRRRLKRDYPILENLIQSSKKGYSIPEEYLT